MRGLGPFGSPIEQDPEASERTSTDARDGEGLAVAGDAASPGCGRFCRLRLPGPGLKRVGHGAHDGQHDRMVALKRVGGDRNTAVIGRFSREAQAKLTHSGAGPLRGAVFLAMECVRGRRLREETAARRREGGFEAICDLFLQTGRGPAGVRGAGLVDRQFTPDDVMVGDDDRVQVMAFGLARANGAPVSAVPVPVAADGPRGEVERTALGSVVGTPTYVSPEQHRGATADVRGDVFSSRRAAPDRPSGSPSPQPGEPPSA
ncbi:hypothetical protein [Nannocystis pusilla]|uniref:hypothetical protein n=1 Tax=Nannocystis pusilla TaxID=889268 RepID=UPI003DA5FFD9